MAAESIAMSVRPLLHFSHRPIGKTTHKKGMSYQHVNYITRDEACSKTLAQNMPADRDGARPYFEHEANKEGVPANARVADTLILALPIELTKEQRHEAVAGFMEKIGEGRIAWLAAFHDKGKDEHNPHCHIIFRDADIETGRKVVGTTTSAKDVREAEEHGWRVPPRMTTKDLRVAWCEHLNAEMERHGLDARFDQRRLKEQGIDREPEIHVGPKAMSMAAKGRDFDSQDRKRGNHANIYSLLDAGSRAEHNNRIIEANRQRALEKANGHAPGARRPLGREGLEKDQLREHQSADRKATYLEQKRDRAALREAHDAQKLEHQRWGRAHYAAARGRAFQEVKTQYADRWKTVRKTKDRTKREEAAQSLKIEQKAAYAKAAKLQIEAVRPAKDDVWQKLKAAQERERTTLQRRHAEEIAAVSRQHIAERIAMQERWHHQNLTARSGKLSAKLEARQDMASVQRTAVAIIKLRAAAQNRYGENRPILNATPSLMVAKHFTERGKAEQANRDTIRYQLNSERQLNQIRGAAPAERRHTPGRIAERRANNRMQIQAQRQAHQQSDPQAAIRQALASGRLLSADERANASPEFKAAIASKGRLDRTRREDAFLRFVNKGSDKGRSGGRSGR
jgi:hypothetical protein